MRGKLDLAIKNATELPHRFSAMRITTGTFIDLHNQINIKNAVLADEETDARSNLNVSAAHVMLVPLQCQVPVFWVDETN